MRLKGKRMNSGLDYYEYISEQRCDEIKNYKNLLKHLKQLKPKNDEEKKEIEDRVADCIKELKQLGGKYYL